MSSKMSLKSVLLAITLVAALHCTLKWFLTHMYFRVTPQMGLTNETFVAFCAFKGLIIGLRKK